MGTRAVLLYPPFTPVTPGPEPSGDAILMVNPVPQEGAALLHQIIQQLPAQRFTLVEGWWDTSGDFAGYPNVTYVHRTYDMAPLYESHRLLLVPSAVEDAFPRVIIEAGLHGLATLSTDRGGIPEAVGYGGKILPSDAGAQTWAAAIGTAPDPLLGKRAREQAAGVIPS